jgi:O-antigen ligase
MGLNLAQYIPFAIYFISFVVAFLSLFVNPAIGVLFLFPLLPYQLIFEKIKLLPLGKDINDIIIFCILIGFISRAAGKRENHVTGNTFSKRKTGLYLPIMLLVAANVIGFLNTTLSYGLGFDLTNNYFLDLKNYMLLPLIWFLTFKNIKNKKILRLLTFLMVIGVLGADYYFYVNLQWMNIWHFSERTRTMMEGLFVYLGANHYGAFFVHFVFILIGIFLFDKSRGRKIILLMSISFTIYCLMYSFSRGAYIAFIAGILFIGFVKERRILLLLFFFFLFWRSLVPISVYERVKMTKNNEGELEESAAIRIVLWNEAMNMFRESPIIGKGFNTFQFTYKDRLWKDTHNFYIKMLVELGIFGLVAFLFLLYKAFLTGWKLYKEADDRFLKGLGLGFSACVISTAITNAFGDRWSYLSLGSYFWIFLGIVTYARVNNMAEPLKPPRIKPALK